MRISSLRRAVVVVAATVSFSLLAPPAVGSLAAAPGDPPGPTPAAPGYAPVLINEVSAASWNGAKDAEGDAKDWVELYNPGVAPADISNWGLSNKPDSPFRWVFPAGTTVGAGKYLVVWLSKKNLNDPAKPLHTTFNLDNGADTLVLTAPNGNATGLLVDQATPPTTAPDQTWCRMPSGDPAAPYQICVKQTPGAANTGDAYGQLAESPSFEPGGGVYSSTQTVRLSGPAGAEIRYTTNGDQPTAKSTLYTGPITVSKGMSIRAASFRAGSGPSLVATASYVIDAQAATKYADQRVIMVTMTASEMSSYKGKSKSAIFAPSVDMREADGSVIYAGGASASVAGLRGSLQSQGNVPLDLSFKDSQGAKNITYPLFPRKGEQTLDRIRLRNSGSDWWYAHLRDSIGGVAMQGSTAIWSDYAPVQMFLNGTYYGMMDMREKEGDTLVESSTGTSKDVVQFYSGDKATAGGKQAETDYAALISWAKRTDMRVPANYAAAQEQIDVVNLAEVMAAFNWSSIWDWPWRNVQVWRSVATDNKWRWKVHDWDITQDSAGHDWGGNTNANYNMYSSRLFGAGNEVFTALMKNEEFRQLYVNAVADGLNARFSPQTGAARVDELADQTQPYIPAFRAAFPSLGTAEAWRTKDVARLRTFATTRPGYVDSTTRSYFKLSARVPVTVAVNDAAMGSVRLNTMDLATLWSAESPTWTGSYYPEVPVTVTAKPVPGYRFVRWEGANTSADATITVPVSANMSLRAVFEKLPSKASAPTLAAQDAIASTTGDYVRVQVPATDPQGYPVTYDAKKLPKGIDIDPVTGVISGRATTPGTYATRVIANNGVAKGEVAFTWTVADRPGTGVNSLPLTGAVQTEFWKNATLNGTPDATLATPMALNLGTAAPNLSGFGTSGFSARWSTSLTPTESGEHVLRVSTEAYDGVRVYVNGDLALDAWAATNSKAQDLDLPIALVAGQRVALTVEFFDKSGAAKAVVTWRTPGAGEFVPIPAAALTAGPATGDTAQAGPTLGPITAEYWSGRAATGTPKATRSLEPSIGLTLASGVAPVPNVSSADYTVRWTTTLTPGADGTHTFRAATSTRDGVRVFVDDRAIIDDWATASAAKTVEGSVDLKAGVPVTLRVEYTNYSSDSRLDLQAKVPGSFGFAPLPAPTAPDGAEGAAPVLSEITSEYFNNTTLAGSAKLTTTDASAIAISVVSGRAPFTGFGTAFSARFTTTLTAATTGTHTLRITDGVSDAVRVWVGGTLVHEDWPAASPAQSVEVPIELVAGEPVELRVEFADPSGEAILNLAVAWPGAATFAPLARAAE